MRFILEGVDGAGKSRLSSYLEEVSGYKTMHLSLHTLTYNGSTLKIKSCLSFYKSLISKNSDIIIDRSFISELVYAPVMGRPGVLTSKEIKEVVDYYIKKNVIVYYVKAPYKLVMERLRLRGESYIDLNMVPDLIKGYNKVMKRLQKAGMKIFIYNSTGL